MIDLKEHINRKRVLLALLKVRRDKVKAEVYLKGNITDLMNIEKEIHQRKNDLLIQTTKYRQMRKITLDRDTLLKPDNVLKLATLYGAEFVRDTADKFAFKYAPNVKDIKFPESKVSKMTDAEYEANREAIFEEMKLFKPESENLTVERTISRNSDGYSYDPRRAEDLKSLFGAEGALQEMGLEGYERFDHELLSSINPQIQRNVKSKTGDNKAGSMKAAMEAV